MDRRGIGVVVRLSSWCRFVVGSIYDLRSQGLRLFLVTRRVLIGSNPITENHPHLMPYLRLTPMKLTHIRKLHAYCQAMETKQMKLSTNCYLM